MSQANVEIVRRFYEAGQRSIEAYGEVLVEGEITTKWKGSGMTLTEPRFMVLTLRDGLIAGSTPTATARQLSKPPGCRSRRGISSRRSRP